MVLDGLVRVRIVSLEASGTAQNHLNTIENYSDRIHKNKHNPVRNSLDICWSSMVPSMRPACLPAWLLGFWPREDTRDAPASKKKPVARNLASTQWRISKHGVRSPRLLHPKCRGDRTSMSNIPTLPKRTTRTRVKLFQHSC